MKKALANKFCSRTFFTNGRTVRDSFKWTQTTCSQTCSRTHFNFISKIYFGRNFQFSMRFVTHFLKMMKLNTREKSKNSLAHCAKKTCIQHLANLWYTTIQSIWKPIKNKANPGANCDIDHASPIQTICQSPTHKLAIGSVLVANMLREKCLLMDVCSKTVTAEKSVGLPCSLCEKVVPNMMEHLMDDHKLNYFKAYETMHKIQRIHKIQTIKRIFTILFA